MDNSNETLCTHCINAIKTTDTTCTSCGEPVNVTHPYMGLDFFLEVCEVGNIPKGAFYDKQNQIHG